MNKRKSMVIIFFIIIIAGVSGLLAYDYLVPEYKEFSDDRIQVEIPYDFNFNFDEKDNSYMNSSAYSTDDNQEGIIAISLDPNFQYAQEVYKKSSAEEKNRLSKYAMNDSKHNYSGTIYKVDPSENFYVNGYIIIVDFPERYGFVVITAHDIKDAIHMAETFNLK
mgnify:CR=1 FL=1